MLQRRRVAPGLVGAVVTALVIGIPTGVVETSWYHRMTPVLWWNYPVWAVTSFLTGALVSTYVQDPTVEVPAPDDNSGRGNGADGSGDDKADKKNGD